MGVSSAHKLDQSLSTSISPQFKNVKEIFSSLQCLVNVMHTNLEDIKSLRLRRMTIDEDIDKIFKALALFTLTLAQAYVKISNNGGRVKSGADEWLKSKHDLRGCLTSIRGYSELILESLVQTDNTIEEQISNRIQSLLDGVSQIISSLDEVR